MVLNIIMIALLRYMNYILQHSTRNVIHNFGSEVFVGALHHY